MFMSLFFNFKNKHFELCCFVMYRVRNIVNRRESDVICHSVRRSQVPTSHSITELWCQEALSCHIFITSIFTFGRGREDFTHIDVAMFS
jgi:hypothetical protein